MAEYPHVRAAFINAIAEEGTKEEAVKFLQAQWNETCALHAENKRLNNALTEAVNQIGDLATQLGQAEGRLVASELVGVVEGWKARAEKAEAERDEALAQVAVAYEAAASSCTNVIKNYDVMKPDGTTYEPIRVQKAAKGMVSLARQDIRALTPADAKSALEAYGREKVREGVKWAARRSRVRECCPECHGTGLRDSGGVQPWGEPIFVTCDCADAILAAMEKEGGE